MLNQQATKENPGYQEINLQILPDPAKNQNWVNDHGDTPQSAAR